MFIDCYVCNKEVQVKGVILDTDKTIAKKVKVASR